VEQNEEINYFILGCSCFVCLCLVYHYTSSFKRKRERERETMLLSSLSECLATHAHKRNTIIYICIYIYIILSYYTHTCLYNNTKSIQHNSHQKSSSAYRFASVLICSATSLISSKSYPHEDNIALPLELRDARSKLVACSESAFS
jgi:hypothetical protein